MQTYPKDYERIVQDSYEAILRPGDIALDIGAHLGRHSIPLAQQVAPSGKVFAFEPLPMCRQALARTLAQQYPELVGVLTLQAQALADFRGQSPFVVAVDDLAYSGLRERTYNTPTQLERIPVAVDTIDHLFGDLPSLRYIKIDAEGGELHILRGAVACLRKFRPVVGFEFGVSAIGAYGITPLEMARFWTAANYRIYTISGDWLGEDAFARSAEQQQIWDYVAVPAEDPVREKAVRETLRRSRVEWLAVTTALRQAEGHAGIGEQVPALPRYRGPLRPLARAVARLVLRLAGIVTIPQRQYNRSLVDSLQRLVDGLEPAEREAGRRDARLRELEQTVASLRESLTRLHQVHQETLEHLADCLAERDAHITHLENKLAATVAITPARKHRPSV
ncbi:MAG: FkbM family methyltransferase [Gemmataceae bacterium]|nr:FkbM family methyltransferase [Gemmataceae bacterium]